MTTIQVRFEYASIERGMCEKIFFQPLFFLAMTIKQRLLARINHPSYNSKMDILELAFPNAEEDGYIIKMEIAPSMINRSYDDTVINMIMDRYLLDDIFTYKGARFHIKTDQEVKHCSLRIGQQEHTVASTYIIEYDAADISKFNDFIQAGVIYFRDFFGGGEECKKRLKLFISSAEGNYFDRIGTRAKRTLNSVILPKVQKDSIVKVITKFLDPVTVKRYEKFNITHKLTILLEGVPGTGKSSLIAALASHFNYNIAIVSFTPKMTDVNLMRALRSFERDNEEVELPTMYVFEDMDCIFKERKSQDESRNMVTFSGILNAFDGITSNENNICIMTTNHIEYLDTALIRPGRVDHIMRFDYAVKEQIVDIFNRYTEEDVTSTKEKAIEFYQAIKNLNIKVTTSLLQQYLLKYADQVDLIIENVEELKTMFDAFNKSTDPALYS
jgi:AAA+ superfamily predicted ATPase